MDDRREIREARGTQTPFLVFNRALELMIMAKLESARNPYLTWDYAEAVDAVLMLLPPRVKQELIGLLRSRDPGVDGVPWAVDVVGYLVEECMAGRDPYSPEPDSYVRCLSLARREVDSLARMIMDLAHEYGLFVVERKKIRTVER